MTTQALFAITVSVLMLAGSPRAQQPAPSAPPTTAAAEVTPCVHAQMVVDRLLEGGMMRIEAARQSNSAAEMRAAIDALAATLRDARAQLVPCAKAEAARDPHSLHAMPADPAADAHAGHPAPAAPAATPAPPAPPAAAKPGAKPATPDPHAGHGATPSKPAAKPTKPAAAPKPPVTPVAPSPAVDPVCGLKVDPTTAPSARHDGQTYHFCSDQHRQSFMKDPAKYLPRK